MKQLSTPPRSPSITPILDSFIGFGVLESTSTKEEGKERRKRSSQSLSLSDEDEELTGTRE